MNAEQREVIQLKLKKANALLNEADILFQNKFYATVINRLYYSCFHATRALLVTKTFFQKHTAALFTSFIFTSFSPKILIRHRRPFLVGSCRKELKKIIPM